MRFDLTRPCGNCPFLKKGGVRLSSARVSQIASAMLSSQGATFACHKTTIDVPCDDGDEDRIETRDSRHCAGALIFAEKNQNATQAMRIAERLRMYDAQAVMADRDAVDGVFDDLEEMLAVNQEEQRPAALRRTRR